MYVHICIYIYTYVCVCVCIHTYISMNIYIVYSRAGTSLSALVILFLCIDEFIASEQSA